MDRALCSICGSRSKYDDDLIIFCDACFLPVHHVCIGEIPALPLDEIPELEHKSEAVVGSIKVKDSFASVESAKGSMDEVEVKDEKMEDVEGSCHQGAVAEEWYCPTCRIVIYQVRFTI